MFYVELYVYFLYLFLDGVFFFEEFIVEVECFGLSVFVLIDYDGFYGVVCFVEVVEFMEVWL